ncbi:MAG: hypothetical protein E4H44_03760, partial [Candidatus Aminicenantes bacterium]
MARLGDFIARNPRVTIAVAIAIWALALIPASQIELRINLESLLPDDSPAALGYREFITRFGGMKRVFVILESAEQEPDLDSFQLAEATTRLAQILGESDEVVDARAGLTDEDISGYLAEIVRRAPLLLPEEDWLNQVESRLELTAIRRRVRELRRSLLSPLPTAEGLFATHDPLGFAPDLLDLAKPGLGQLVDPLTLAFLSQDGRAGLILVEPSGSELDAPSGRRLADAISSSVQLLENEFGHDFRVRSVGGPLYAAHDEEIIRPDLVRTLAVTSIGCGLLIAAVFSGVAIPLAALAALAVGLTWTAAFFTITSGGVSAAAIGFSAVLVGLGIDSAIHGGAAFRHHLLAGDHRTSAISKAFRDTGRPVIAAAATTAAAFSVLLVSGLPLLRELGSMVAVGIGLTVVSTATLGASLVVVMSGSSNRGSWLWRLLGQLVHSIVRFSGRHSRFILIGATLLTAATIPAALNTDVQASLNGLRPLDHPVLEAEMALTELFGIYEETTTIIIRSESLDESLNTVRAIQRGLNNLSPGIGFISPADRLTGPTMAAKRLEKLTTLNFSEAIDTLRVELRAAGLNEVAFASGIEALESFASGIDPGTEDPTDDQQLRFDSDGTVWAALTVLPPDEGWSIKTMKNLRDVVTELDQDALVASMPLVGSDLQRIASRDLRRLSLLSLVLVFGVVLLSFRGRIGLTMVALLPVTLGTIWTLGFWNVLGHHLDLVGLAVLPVMLGLGIDDGLHAVHGAAGSTSQGLRSSLERSGRAMALTTLTTCIGFGSLVFSHLPSLRAIAVLVPIGVGACLLSTLMVLPAFASSKWGLK